MRKSVKCARCGKSEKYKSVFEQVEDFKLCVDCAQIAYSEKDAIKFGNMVEAELLKKEFEVGIIDGILKDKVTEWHNKWRNS